MTRARFALAFVALAGLSLGACGDGEPPDPELVDVPGGDGRLKSAPAVRLARRAFDGAPPVIPHAPVGDSCLACHNARGIEIPDLGFAPPMPHAMTSGFSAITRCVQCHVYRATDDVFAESDFVAHRAGGTPPHRAFDGAPPVMPHRVFMRESCLSCHSGPAAREEIRTTHPERSNCVQCHLPAQTEREFARIP